MATVYHKLSSSGLIASGNSQVSLENIREMLDIKVTARSDLISCHEFFEIIEKLTKIAVSENLHLKRRLAQEAQLRRDLEEKLRSRH